MSNKKIMIAAAAAIVCAAAMSAQEGNDPMMQAIKVIVENSPQLSQERAAARALSLDAADGNALSNPEVEFARVWGRHDIGNKLQLDISQAFDWPGLYRARGRAASTQALAANMQTLATELDIALQAKLQLYELVCVRKRIEFTSQLLGNLKSLQQAMEQAFEQGYIGELDKRKMRIEVSKIEFELASLKAEEAGILGSLQALCPVRLDLSGIDAYPMENLLTLDDYLAQIESLDPQVAAQRLTVQAEGDNASVARLQRMPSFSLGYQHQAEMGDRFNGFTASMTLPFFENRHARSSALARQESAGFAADALVMQKQARMRSLMSEIELWREQVDMYNNVFGDQAYLKLLNKAYKGGEINIMDYLTEVQYYGDITKAWIEAEHNYRVAMAELNQYSLIHQ